MPVPLPCFLLHTCTKMPSHLARVRFEMSSSGHRHLWEASHCLLTHSAEANESLKPFFVFALIMSTANMSAYTVKGGFNSDYCFCVFKCVQMLHQDLLTQMLSHEHIESVRPFTCFIITIQTGGQKNMHFILAVVSFSI